MPKLKTYAEQVGEKKFCWERELMAAIKDVPDRSIRLRTNQHFELLEKSGHWTTCACGNQCSIIPRRKDGAPKNMALRKLGTEFYEDLLFACWEEALDTLAAIERLSAKIIKEIKSRKEPK